MQIDILTLFPQMIEPYIKESIIGRAQKNGRLSITLTNIRDFALDKHRKTDDTPYGGGGGMVLKPEPIFDAVESLDLADDAPIILLTPQGRVFTQEIANELVQHERVVFLCGRYEGVDERVREHLVTDEISIGDYVLTGGELGAMVVVDAMARLLPEVLGAENGAEEDSHATGLLEGAHYTKPPTFQGWDIPDVLASGHDAKIQEWRKQSSLRRTWERRPEMLLSADLSESDKQFLAKLANETTEKIINAKAQNRKE